MKKIALMFTWVVVILGMIVSCCGIWYLQEKSNTSTTDDLGKVNEEIELSNPDKELNDKVEKVLDSMSLEEKVGQLFILEIDALNGGDKTTIFNDNMATRLKKYNVGGVIAFANNIVSREQTIALNEKLQKNSEIPLFISVDEEGGMVSRIGSNSNMGTTKFGNMRAIGDSGNYEKAYEVGSTIGKEINELGFNLDFAPDADIITNPNNTEIGNRSFGTDAEIVAKMSLEVVKGLQENGVSATLKHFPGHGGSENNSHNEYSYTNQTLEGMRKIEFVPFKLGITEGVDFILVSHIAAPNVTGDKIPSSLNPKIINELLREELGYDGIVTTDALNMKAVSNYYGPDEAGVAALNAGVDVLLMPTNIDVMYNSILTACKEGKLTEERIDESVKRILKVKVKRGILE